MRRGLRLPGQSLAIGMLMVLVAAACGGAAPATELAQSAPAPAFDGETPTTADAPATAVPTTAPIVIAEPAPTVEPPAAPASEPSLDASAQNPWLVDVLHVNDDATIIPAFDGPNGNPITLTDVNEIDGIEWEYPLLAETVFGNRLALLVEEFDSSGAWAKVQVPVRPNGTTAWVQTAFFRTESHDYHITIDLSDNLVNVYKGDDLLIEQIAVSGRESRPTPVVRSYIDEKIRGDTLSPAYGDWVLSIAGFSEALGTFGGGMPKLALHGTNQPELMGEYVSSGCVRVPNDVVSFIAENVPVGTVVDIIA